MVFCHVPCLTDLFYELNKYEGRKCKGGTFQPIRSSIISVTSLLGIFRQNILCDSQVGSVTMKLHHVVFWSLKFRIQVSQVLWDVLINYIEIESAPRILCSTASTCAQVCIQNFRQRIYMYMNEFSYRKIQSKYRSKKYK